MADTKITALAAITVVDPAADVLPIVDISDTSMAASGTTKKVTSNQILGSGGVATLASATITGALTVDTTTLVVNPSGYTDRVGIGTASPGAALEVSGSATNVFIRSTDTNDSALRYYVNGTEVAVCRGKNGNSYAIETAGAESFRINSTGNIVLKGGTVGANGVGVTFPATQVASSDANCLDDYEEGTFTPSIGGTATYTTNSGRYTKIGNRVYASIRLTVLLVGTGSSSVISGLPFVVSTNPHPVSVGYFTNLAISVNYVSGYADNGTSIINMTATTAATTNITNGAAVIGNGTDLAISFFYEV